MRLRKRYDRPIHSKLARLKDTLSQKAELTFARTAGALGASPYALSSDEAQQVRALIAMMPDEEPRLDYASAVLTEEREAASEWTRSEIGKHGERNAMEILNELANSPGLSRKDKTARPYQVGIALAASLREHFKLAPDVSVAGVSRLATIFGADDFQASSSAPASLRAFQSQVRDAPTIVAEDEGPRNTAFILARATGDFLAFQSKASCVADLYTDRQAVGRAFAAEFLAPARGVVTMIEEEDQPISRVADHYGVPYEVISNQFTNNYRRFIEA